MNEELLIPEDINTTSVPDHWMVIDILAEQTIYRTGLTEMVYGLTPAKDRDNAERSSLD